VRSSADTTIPQQQQLGNSLPKRNQAVGVGPGLIALNKGGVLLGPGGGEEGKTVTPTSVQRSVFVSGSGRINGELEGTSITRIPGDSLEMYS